MATVVEHIAGFDYSLAAGAVLGGRLGHGPRRRAGRPRLPARWSAPGLPAERDINLVTATLRQAQSALTFYADPAWAPTGWAAAGRRRPAPRCAPPTPGSGFQLAWARAFAAAARTDDGPGRAARLAATARTCRPGLTIDTDLRWGCCSRWSRTGAADPAEIEAELDRDRTASGERAGRAGPRAGADRRRRRPRPGVGSPSADDAAELAATRAAAGLPAPVPGRADRAVRRPRSSTCVDEVWANRDSEPAAGVRRARPTRATRSARTRWRRPTPGWPRAGHPAPLRRLVGRGPRRRGPGPEGAGQGRRGRADRRGDSEQAAVRHGRPLSAWPSATGAAAEVVRSGAAGVVGQLGQPGDDAAGQVAAAERGAIDSAASLRRGRGSAGGPRRR